jgi:hypothetical protein
VEKLLGADVTEAIAAKLEYSETTPSIEAVVRTTRMAAVSLQWD